MPRSRTLGGLFDLDGLQEAIADNESKMADPDFWNNQEEAQKVINENNELKNKYDNFNQLEEAIEDLEVLLEMVQEEDDDELVSEDAGVSAVTSFERQVRQRQCYFGTSSRSRRDRISRLGIDAAQNVYSLGRTARVQC